MKTINSSIIFIISTVSTRSSLVTDIRYIMMTKTLSRTITILSSAEFESLIGISSTSSSATMSEFWPLTKTWLTKSVLWSTLTKPFYTTGSNTYIILTSSF